MPRDRDVAAFAERTDGYEKGWLGRLHHEIADRSADLALAPVPAPRRVARFQAGAAEHLPEPDGAFDLVVSTTSFDHWADQQSGLRECARVMAPGGRLVLVGQFSPLYLPTLIGSRRGQARTRRRATRLLTRAGFRSPEWHALYAVIIGAVTASR
jgi:SAM-dependent methyltransferase